jgi:hypothetical protein
MKSHFIILGAALLFAALDLWMDIGTALLLSHSLARVAEPKGRTQMTSSGQVSDAVTLRPTWKENLYTALVVFVVLGAIFS